MKPIIDCHTHVYPDRIAERAAENLGRFYRFTVAESGTFSDLLSCERAAGIGGILILPVATSAKHVEKINEAAAAEAAAARAAGFEAEAFGSFHGDHPDPAAVLDQIEALGLKGVKLHPDLQGVPVDAPSLLPLYEAMQERGLRLYLHVGDDRPEVDGSSPERVAAIAAAFPRLVIAAAHLGGYRVWDRAEKCLMGRFDNVWYDCSSSLWAMEPARGRYLIELCGVNRMMFGSDYPAISPAVSLAEFDRLGFSDADRQAILSDNVRRFAGFRET